MDSSDVALAALLPEAPFEPALQGAREALRQLLRTTPPATLVDPIGVPLLAVDAAVYRSAMSLDVIADAVRRDEQLALVPGLVPDEAPLRSGPLSDLHWVLAITDEQAGPSPVDVRSEFRLMRWPGLDRLPHRRGHMRAISMLLTRWIRYDALVNLSGTPGPLVWQAICACRALGLLQQRQVDAVAGTATLRLPAAAAPTLVSDAASAAMPADVPAPEPHERVRLLPSLSDLARQIRRSLARETT